MNYINVSAQLMAVAAIIVWNLSIQNKKLEKILYFQFLANLLYCMEYLLLGSIIAFLMNLISALRCYIFYYKNKLNKHISKKWLLFFIVLIIIVGSMNYNGAISLIPILITLIYTIASWQKEASWSRITFLLAAFLWIYYNFCVGAYVGIIGNILEILSGTISLIRFRKSKLQ